MAQTKKGHDPAERDENGRFKSGHTPLWTPPEGNDYASKYDEKYCDEILEYFAVDPIETYQDNDGITRFKAVRYPTVERFAANIGVTVSTIQNWRAQHERFGVAYQRALEMQRDVLITNGLTGAYNPAFAKFVASTTHGMVEKTAVDVGNEGAKPFEVNIKVVD
jgi:hypothetical protein